MKVRTLLLFLVMAFPLMGLADDAGGILVPDPMLSFISQVLGYLESQFPVVAEIIKWIGVVVSTATFLSYALQGILAVPEIAARWAGAHDFADKLKYWSDKIVYWFKYISMRNAQK